MTDPTDIDEEDKPIWEEAFQPPPWEAEVDEDFGPVEGFSPDDIYHVVAYGYDDETPVVCAGTKSWPLLREQALILAASLDSLKVCRELDRHWTEDFPEGPDGKVEILGGAGRLSEDTLAIWRSARAAIAKAEGKT